MTPDQRLDQLTQALFQLAVAMRIMQGYLQQPADIVVERGSLPSYINAALDTVDAVLEEALDGPSTPRRTANVLMFRRPGGAK